MNTHRNWILGISFIIGMTVCALLAGHTIRSVKRLDEFVTVKGLSEREVAADLAIWPIAFSVSENDLAALQQKIAKGRGAVQQFLTAQGFDAAEISQAPPRIQELTGTKDDDQPHFRY